MGRFTAVMLTEARDRSAARHMHKKRWELPEHQPRLPSGPRSLCWVLDSVVSKRRGSQTGIRARMEEGRWKGHGHKGSYKVRGRRRKRRWCYREK